MILARKLPRIAANESRAMLAANEKIVHLVRHGHGEHNAAGILARVVYGTYDSMVVSESFKEIQSVTSFLNQNVLKYQELWSQNKKEEATAASWSIYASDLEEEQAYVKSIHADYAFQNNKNFDEEPPPHDSKINEEVGKSTETCEFNPRLEHYFDAQLTERGIKQCKALAHDPPSCIETAQLLVVSPMQRTLQTATYSFPSLMGKIPWVACELIRERSGLHPCDRRRNLEEYKPRFPHVDFSLIHDEEDPLFYIWDGKREPRSHVMDRSWHFFAKWLSHREENEIIVVTHSSFLDITIHDVIKTGEFYDYRFSNCEVRSFILSLDE